jgi:protein SCO1/2
MKRFSFLVLGIVLGLALIGTTAFAAGRLLRPRELHGAVIQSPDPARDFTLTAHFGQPVSLSDYRGRVVLLYFGYTTCPDVCPATLAELKKARAALGKDADKVQVLMVTVDPERDTPALLADYLTHFDPSFVGLTGAPDQIAEAATYYGIYYARHESESALGYLMDHTATVMLVDSKGHLRAVYPFGTPGEDIGSDLKSLISE